MDSVFPPGSAMAYFPAWGHLLLQTHGSLLPVTEYLKTHIGWFLNIPSPSILYTSCCSQTTHTIINGCSLETPEVYRDLLAAVQVLIQRFDLDTRGYRLITNGGGRINPFPMHWHLVSEPLET